MAVNRFDVYLVNLDPTVGLEIQKKRPCAVISPDEMNHHIQTVIIAPMTTKGTSFPSRIACRFVDLRARTAKLCWIRFAP